MNLSATVKWLIVLSVFTVIGISIGIAALIYKNYGVPPTVDAGATGDEVLDPGGVRDFLVRSDTVTAFTVNNVMFVLYNFILTEPLDVGDKIEVYSFQKERIAPLVPILEEIYTSFAFVEFVPENGSETVALPLIAETSNDPSDSESVYLKVFNSTGAILPALTKIEGSVRLHLTKIIV